jgi:hypothetical protein
MILRIELLNFLSEGEFFLGIECGKKDLFGSPIDEFTGEDIEGDIVILGDYYNISIGLFFITINIGIHVKIEDGNNI